MLGPRFYDYLNGLREFELQQSNSRSAKSSKSRRFNNFLDSLECEFEIITEDIESLRKERDELKVTVEAQAMELRNVRNNVICQRCNNETPPNIAPFPLKTSETAPSIPVVQKSLQKPNASLTLHPENVTPPSPLSWASVSTVDPDHSGPADYVNDGVGKELSVEMAHALAHREAILCVNFSQDGKYIAAGCQDGRAYVYDVQTGTLIRVLRDLLAERDTIGTVCFNRDGKYLATGSRCGSIYVWEINKKHVRNTFKGYTQWVRSLDFSPNGRLLVSTSESSVRLWNMRDGAAKDLTDDNPKALNPYYTSAVFSPDGEHVAASHRDGMVRVWHVCTVQLMRRVKAHMDIMFDVGFTPDGNGLVTGGGDPTLKYWDISSWNPTFIRARSQTSDLDRRVSAVEEQTLPEREYSGHDHSGRCLAISPDGRWVASGSVNGTVCIWDTRSRAMQCSLTHSDWICSVKFSPAGHYLASGTGDGILWIWRYSNITSDVIQIYDGP